MSDILTIRSLIRCFGKVVANDNIDLRIRRGEIVGLLGHNGAGKTTLVSQLIGLLKPDAGSIQVGELDAVAHPAAARRVVSVQAQSQAPLMVSPHELRLRLPVGSVASRRNSKRQQRKGLQKS